MFDDLLDTVMLVPANIVERAKELKKKRKYADALKLLSEHAIKFEIYDEHMTVALPIHKTGRAYIKEQIKKGNIFI